MILVAHAPVGRRNRVHLMASLGPLGHTPAGEEFGIVGMCVHRQNVHDQLLSSPSVAADPGVEPVPISYLSLCRLPRAAEIRGQRSRRAATKEQRRGRRLSEDWELEIGVAAPEARRR